VTREERELLELFRGLGAQEQRMLTAFARFLAARSGGDAAEIVEEPLPIERPREETVVMAIKRLTRTYPMLDRRKLLAETSQFVAEYAVGGRAASEVIDELEALFERHYRRMKAEG
jgi:hypothetical protein